MKYTLDNGMQSQRQIARWYLQVLYRTVSTALYGCTCFRDADIFHIYLYKWTNLTKVVLRHCSNTYVRASVLYKSVIKTAVGMNFKS